MNKLFKKAPLWEQYRPQTKDGGKNEYDLGLVINEDLSKKLDQWKEDKTIPHILMAGDSGIGKTTLAKIICSDILNTIDVLEINASEQTGIDYIRNTVKSFVTGQSLDGDLKVVILGEADGLSDQAMSCLNEIIENFGESTRFILTTNNINKISSPLASRCTTLDIEYSYGEYVKRVVDILIKEGYKITKSEVSDKIAPVCKENFPDFRRVLNAIESISIDGVIKGDIASDSKLLDELWDMITDVKVAPEDVRSCYISRYNDFGGKYYTLLLNLVRRSFKHKDKAFNRKFITSSNQAFRSVGHIDPEINMYQVIIDVKK